jgi:MoaA/NifB/PqqE/SkfB family radical SAM enzyme
METRWRRIVQSWGLLRALVDARLRARPILLSHLVTCRCPCRCQTCLWRGLVDEEMTADQIAHFYREAAAMGMVINSIWGGEPVVRADLADILRASRTAGLVTVLITSGWRFHERFDEIIPWPDLVIFSLDFPSPEHDRSRGMPGLYDSVEQAIERIRGRAGGPRVAVNSVISRLNAHVVTDLVKWAGARSVPIYLHPIETGRTRGDAHGPESKEPLAVADEDLAKLFRQLIALKTAGYPIANSIPYLRTFSHGKQPYRCHARKVCLQLWPNGDLVDCLDRGRAVANVRESSLPELLGRPEIRKLRLMPVDCHSCNNANVIDTSYVWELRMESIVALIRAHVSHGSRPRVRP